MFSLFKTIQIGFLSKIFFSKFFDTQVHKALSVATALEDYIQSIYLLMKFFQIRAQTKSSM